MSSHEAYLKSALAKYQYPDLAKRDILNALGTYDNLQPRLDWFLFNTGARKELVCLDGTVPVNYRGNRYNIPVVLWLTESHPNNPPRVFVKPTQNMQIKHGKHVDIAGKIYLPYLSDWKHPQSDLLGLIQILTIIFGEEPPVFATHSNSSSNQNRTPYQNPHATPPYPPQGGGMPLPYSNRPPAYPPTTNNYSNYPAGSYPAYPPSVSTPNIPATNSYPNYTPYTPTTHGQTLSQTQGSTSLTDEQITTMLRSDVEDKIKKKLQEILAQSQAEMQTLKQTEKDLQNGSKILTDMVSKINNEQSEVDTNITILNQKTSETEQLIEKLKQADDIDIDEAIVPATPLHKQLLAVFCEEQATQDIIYYLSEGFKRDVIDLDAYLKQVREQSRKQFLLRALIQKIRQKAGLPDM